MSFQIIFDDDTAAAGYLEQHVFPIISERIRLFKTPKLLGDQFIIIDPDWLGDDLSQTYGYDHDMGNILHAHGLPDVVYIKDGKKLATRKVLREWKRQLTTQQQRLNGLCYLPNQPSVVGRKFNTFRDVSVPAIPNVQVDEMLTHIRTNICNGRHEYAEYLLNWLAHLLQKPTERPKTGIAIIGGQGTGKGIFIDFLHNMLGGERNSNTTASSDDTKGFNYALGNKLFVVFDEATFAGDRKQSDFMKKLVTEPRIRVEQKGIDAYEVDNFARVLITSNNMQSAVPATIGARRWLIIECRNDLVQADLKKLADLVGNNPGHPDHRVDYLGGFKWFLEQRDISAFSPQQLPMQDTGIETKIHNLYKEDPIFAFLIEWLSADDLTLFRAVRDADGEMLDMPLKWHDRVSFAEFYDVFVQRCKECFATPPGRNTMKQKLQPYGIVVAATTGNIRVLDLPPPNDVLVVLDAVARFDKLLSDEQRRVVFDHSMRTEELAALAFKAIDRPTRKRKRDEAVDQEVERLLTPYGEFVSSVSSGVGQRAFEDDMVAVGTPADVADVETPEVVRLGL